jgi:hypothetical protein
VSKKVEARFLNASEIANLAYCERKVAFDAAHGRRTTPEQRRAEDRGLRAHDQFYRESLRLAARTSERKGKCFIATLALGDCPETRALRAFRDLYLRRSLAGRRIIATYYRFSPLICRWMEARPLWVRAARLPLRALASVAAILVDMKLR